MTMKSKIKQDFNDENQEEVIEIQRRIIVKISDPDATESSSDDEKQEKRPKLIVHEIIQEKVKIQSFKLNSKNPLDFYQFSGKLPPVVRKRQCGKFHEMAISAKSGTPPLMVDSQTSDSSKVKNRFSLKNRNPLTFDQSSGKLPPMVRKRKNGKFATEIKNPFTKKRIWLGTFNTPEEASEVYQSKKLEFQKRLEKAKNANVKKTISAKSGNPPLMVDSQTSDSSKVKNRLSLKNGNPLNFDLSSGKLPPMVRKRKNGKFATEIKDPFTKKRIWLRTFNTPEEASEVYQSKKLEFQKRLEVAKNANVKKAISAKSEIGSSSSRNLPLMVDGHTDSSNESIDRLKMAKNAKGQKVISAKSGLGSSSSNALLMVDEFDEQLKKAINAKVEKGVSANSELGSSSSDPLLIVDEFDEQLKKATNANVKKVISAKSELGSSSSDQNAQTSDSSNGVEGKDQESDEEMWMGQWIQISGDQEVKFSQKLGVPVVDNYGFLLGEFSKLDDLSISV